MHKIVLAIKDNLIDSCHLIEIILLLNLLLFGLQQPRVALFVYKSKVSSVFNGINLILAIPFEEGHMWR